MTVQTKYPDWVRDLKPYVPGKPVEELERELGIRNAIKLASNENPMGASPAAIEAMIQAAQNAHLYPDAGNYYLKEKLASRFGVHSDRIMVGNGSNELLTLLVRAFTTPDDHVVISEGAFIAYTVVLSAAGTPFTQVPMGPHWTHDLEAMAAACTEKTRLLFVANPNNPTGTHQGEAAVRKLLRSVPEHVLVILDEAYFEYGWAEDYPDGMNLLSERDNLVVMRTFSKGYGLAGNRVGYGVGPAYVADLVQRIREPFSVNLLGQAAALAAIEDEDFLAKSVAVNRDEMKRLVPALCELGYATFETQTNFLFVHAPMGGPALYDALLRKGVIVRPLVPYGMLDHVRVSIGLPEENSRLLEALQEIDKGA